MIALAFIGIVLVCYFIGNISFARIITWRVARKDITSEGSGNPGAMNVMRNHGFGVAFITLICDVIKCGLPSLIAYFCMRGYGLENVAYFVASLSTILGHNFPILFKFKGGKGVACTFGMFLFHPSFWWITIIVFLFCALIFFFLDYGFLASLIFCTIMSTISIVMLSLWASPYFYIPVIFIGFDLLLLFIMHSGNFKRMLSGTEKKMGFRHKLYEFFHKGKGGEIAVNEGESDTPEEEIIIEPDHKNEK